MTIGCRTNAIFVEAVDEGLELEIDSIRHGQKFSDRRLARMFGGDVAVLRELQHLRDRNAAGLHYELGAYHNALLYSFLVDFVEDMHVAHEGESMVFGSGRYLVRQVDAAAFETAFFADTDFVLPGEIVNEYGGAEKHALGMDDGVFGVANALPPHGEELEVRPAPMSSVEPIIELSAAQEAELRRRHQVAPRVVSREIAAMGWVYRRGETFPYWPAWLPVDEAD